MSDTPGTSPDHSTQGAAPDGAAGGTGAVAAAGATTAEYIPFEEFQAGLPAGEFNVIVNPKLARSYVMRRLSILQLTIAIIGIGLAVALSGHIWIGGLMVAAGVIISRVAKAQSGKMLLHMALNNPQVYLDATTHGVMEVQRR